MSPSIKKIFLPEYFLYLGFGILFWFSTVGCNTRIQGCLDVNANNFDLNAELSCDGCCTYPSSLLSLTQKWNDRNFASTDTLYDLHGQPYKLRDLKYFLSAWNWKDSNGSLYTVDSVNAICDDDQFTYAPDNLMIDINQFIYTMGTIRQSPNIDSLYFLIGIAQDFSCLDTEDPETPSELTNQSPLWNPQTEALETMRIVVQRDLNTENFDTVFIANTAQIQLPYSYQMVAGENTSFTLTVNYAQWFQDVDISDPNTFAMSLIANFAGSISRTP